MGPPGMPTPGMLGVPPQMGMFGGGLPLPGMGPRPMENPGSDLESILSRPTIRDKHRTER